MKKLKNILVVLLLVVLVTGCGKKEEPKKESVWVSNTSVESLKMTDKATTAFEEGTKEYVGMKLEAVAALGYQNIDGKKPVTNFMYLAKGTETNKVTTTKYVIIVIESNKKGKYTVKEVKDFDLTQYVFKDIPVNTDPVVGGYTVYTSTKATTLAKDVNAAFTSSLTDFVGTSYTPVAYIGYKEEAKGINYAVVALGKTTTKDPIASINVLTINSDTKGNGTLKSIAYVDLNSLV